MLIGITGHKRHGKDSTADVFVKFGYTKHAFADPMKDALCLIFGWTREYIEDHKDEVDPEWGISPRMALVYLGTDYGQWTLGKVPTFAEKTGRLLWVKRLLKDYSPEDKWVISDVRFPHEEEYIHGLGGTIILVDRPSVLPDLTIESERSILEVYWDMFICNDGSLQDLQHNAEFLVHSV